MRNDPIRRVVEAERSTAGVVVTFDDGITALYLADLLYAHIDECQTFLPLPPDVLTSE